MVVVTAARKRAEHRREGGRARLRAPNVEHARLVAAAAPARELVPAKCTEEGPRGHGADADTLGVERGSGIPDLREPAQLLVARAAVVRLRHGERQPVAQPGLAQQTLRARRAVGEHARREYVGVAVAAVAPVRVFRVAIQVFVEEPLAAQVVIDADDIGRAGVLGEPRELALLEP
jgi:hypothetical protein